MRTIFTVSALIAIMMISCSDNPLAVVDDYNSPANVRSAPSNAAVVIDFTSANDASDFLGFNVYISMSSNMAVARVISNANGTLPTVSSALHAYSNVRLFITNDANYKPITNTLTYYVAVSAYGTNNYPSRLFQQGLGGNAAGVIELTPTQMSAVTPRLEGAIVFTNKTFPDSTADDGVQYSAVNTNCTVIADNAATEAVDASAFICIYTNIPGPTVIPYAASGAASGFQMQDLGYQNDFYSVTQMPSGGYLPAGTHFVMSINHMYALFNGTSTYIKIWVTGIAESAGKVTVTARWAAIIGSGRL